jgi:hypothetical protein
MTRTATSLLHCFLGTPLLESAYPNNDGCIDIGISSRADGLCDRDRVKKVTYGHRRISWKTAMAQKIDDRWPCSNFLIEQWIKMHSRKWDRKIG